MLDLGSGYGSFAEDATAALVIRCDLEPRTPARGSVAADAASLPFRDGAFAAAIANHSLEHIAGLDAALGELGRAIAKDGALYVAVPDARTLTDRIYRWLGRGGGHVNAFVGAEETARRIERATGLARRGTRLLDTSLSFLNRRNLPGRAPLRLWLLGGGSEGILRWTVYLARRIDRWRGTRLSVYGWAFYFGSVEPEDTTVWTNVCVRCGAGHPSAWLEGEGRLRLRKRLPDDYRCPACGARNLFTPDRERRPSSPPATEEREMQVPAPVAKKVRS